MDAGGRVALIAKRHQPKLVEGRAEHAADDLAVGRVPLRAQAIRQLEASLAGVALAWTQNVWVAVLERRAERVQRVPDTRLAGQQQLLHGLARDGNIQVERLPLVVI